MSSKSSTLPLIRRPFFKILAILSHTSLVSRAFSSSSSSAPAATATTIMSTASKVVLRKEPLSFPMTTLDPFLFCVYHNDKYPAGDDKMQAPRRGNGADFNPSAPYRMYHGDRIPGFPQHPHRGFETVTATLTGLIDHSDSAGNAGRYGGGDLQWMTAGRGVVHGEMFPLVHSDKPNTLRLFQIWLNLPKKSKMAEPGFAMHWAEEIPHITGSDGKSDVTVWAGALPDASAAAGSAGPETTGVVNEVRGLPPPPASYARNPDADLGIFLIRLPPGSSYTLPPARGGRTTNRMAYYVEGESLSVAGESLTSRCALTLRADAEATFANPASSGPETEVLILQGRPINEPVAQHGPFVMNTDEEIMQAFADYRRTQFGGWPWPDDAMVFPRDKGRFALLGGKEQLPPAANK